MYRSRRYSIVPIDLEVASTPRIRYPFQLMTLPPAASTLSISSGRSGCVPSKQEKDINVPTHYCPTKLELQKKRNCSKGSYPSKEKFPNVLHGQAIDTTNIQNHQLAVQNDGYDEK